MEEILIKAEKRQEIGKGKARRLRREGLLPAVIYSKGKATHIKLQKREIGRLISLGLGEHALLKIELSNGDGTTHDHHVLIKDYQTDPVTDELLHVDFIEVSLKERISLMVPVMITREPAGVKKGGIMEQHLREVEVECLPTQIPEAIEVDAGHIEIGHSLHVSDLQPPEGVRILTDPEEVILTVLEPKVEEVAAPPAEEEAAEPELVKEKAKEEEKVEKEEKEG
jgi:large subunit ribosomal protein L25